MYILFVSRGYPTKKFKMNGIFEFDQAKAIANLGHKVIFAVVDVRSIRHWRKWGIEKQYKDGVQIYAMNIPLGRVPNTILTMISNISLRILYREIKKEQGKPDVIHAHFTRTGYISSRLKRTVKIPLVITEHSSKINKNKIDKKLFNKAKEAYINSDAVIAVSPSLANKIEKEFGISPIYIPNIVDTKIFKYTPKKYAEGFNFVSTGNLIRSKRMDLTIEAFSRAFKNNKNVTLTIFGEGPERTRLQELITRYDLNSKVFLKGMCPRDDIAKQLSKSDCFVLASQSETFGVAYIEAMAMGVPVIATKCGGPETFVNNDNGLIVSVDNIDELSNAMKYMYENIHNFDREKISRETTDLFGPEKVAQRIVEVYYAITN